MLRDVHPGRVAVTGNPLVPDFLTPLVEAATSGASLDPIMLSIVRRFGFEAFSFGVSTDPRPDRDSNTYIWNSFPREWMTVYDQRAYVEVDPRVQMAIDRNTPLIWDYTSVPDDARTRAFLDAAAKYGICSGVVVPLHYSRQPFAGLGMTASERAILPARRAAICSSLGDILLFATTLHSIFLTTIVDMGVPPSHQGAPLSSREIECLALAAKGMTTGHIATRLGITERTVAFHFSNVNSKLATRNRTEAIAIAVRQQLLPG